MRVFRFLLFFGDGNGNGYSEFFGGLSIGLSKGLLKDK